MKQFEIVTEPIQTEQYREFTINEHQGAVVVFTGHVREWTKGIKTEYLEYRAYISMAEKKLAQIGDEIGSALARNDYNHCSSHWATSNFRYSGVNCSFITPS